MAELLEANTGPNTEAPDVAALIHKAPSEPQSLQTESSPQDNKILCTRMTPSAHSPGGMKAHTQCQAPKNL